MIEKLKDDSYWVQLLAAGPGLMHIIIDVITFSKIILPRKGTINTNQIYSSYLNRGVVILGEGGGGYRISGAWHVR